MAWASVSGGRHGCGASAAKLIRLRHAAAMLALLFSTACGSSITAPPTNSLLDPSEPRSPNPALTVSAAGVDPQTLHLDSPVSVKFTNADHVAHKFEAALELGDGDCPEMNQLPTLEPGQNGSVAFTRSGVICAFHDAGAPTNFAFKGLIVLH
jgi:hypothetical protein